MKLGSNDTSTDVRRFSCYIRSDTDNDTLYQVHLDNNTLYFFNYIDGTTYGTTNVLWTPSLRL